MSSAAIRKNLYREAVEQEVLIECPACHTTFRVEASRLGASTESYGSSALQSKARFHCSRCDYVFAAEMSSAGAAESAEATTEYEETTPELTAPLYQEPISPHETVDQKAEVPFDPDEAARQFEEYRAKRWQEAPVPPGESEPEMKVEVPEELIFETAESPDPVAEQDRLVNSTVVDSFDFPEPPLEKKKTEEAESLRSNSTDATQLEFNFQSAPNLSTRDSGEPEQSQHSNPHWSAEPSLEPKVPAPFSPTTPTPDVEATRYVDSSEFTAEKFPSLNIEEATAVPTEDVEATKLYNEQTFPWSSREDKHFSQLKQEAGSEDYSRYAQDFTSQKDQGDVVIADRTREQIFGKDSAYASATQAGQFASPATSRARTFFTPFQSIAIFIVPLLLVFSLLGALTLYLRNDLSGSERLLSSLFPAAMREAPAGLFIQQPKFEVVVLDSGDTVRVLSGSVINQSKKALSAVMIEGLGFTDTGRVISEKTLAGNDLSNSASLRSFAPSDIKLLQQREPKNFLLRPGGKQNFVLVFSSTPKSGSSAVDSSSISSFAARIHSVRYAH